MGMGQGETSLFPNGNIAVSVFVKLDPTPGYCLQADAGSQPFGVAGPETHTPAIQIDGVDLDDGLAGVAGGPAIKIYGVGSTNVPLRVAGTTAVGDRLIPDANGYGEVTVADRKSIGAIARESGIANNIIAVDIVRFDSSNA